MATPRIDCLQYANWSEKVFRQMNEGGMHAVHATLAYHENFRALAANVADWNDRFRRYAGLIRHGKTAADVDAAMQDGRTAIFFGAQTPAPVEDEIGLVEVCHTLGIRFMQLTYNNQSLLAGGCHEPHDSGISRFGREVIAEMNRVGMVVDMSHSGEKSTLQAVECSTRPIAITHANPKWWHDCPRNHTDAVFSALAQSGGMIGFSLYPHHLAGGSGCTLAAFCQMVAEAAGRYGVACLGIGTDLCQDQPDAVVGWMRDGRWRRPSGEDAAFPPPLKWFQSNLDFANLAAGLAEAGLGEDDVASIMGGNWLRFYRDSFEPKQGSAA